MTPVLETRGLKVGYRSGRRVTEVLSNLDLRVYAGEFVCLLGPNGIGKSTLLKTFSGILSPLSGSVRLGGRELGGLSIDEVARLLSVVLTDKLEVGSLTGYKVVELGRFPHIGWGGRLSSLDHGVVRWAVESVGGTHLAARDVNELSDGERQRILVARALAQQPKLMLLDEPTAFLDVGARIELVGLLRNLVRQNELAVVFSTHDLELALRTADTVWLLDTDGELHVGGPEDLVRNCELERAFHVEGLTFDPYERSFRMACNGVGSASVEGSGLGATLARVTLEREGYSVITDSDGSADVEVVARESGDTIWEARRNGVWESGATYSELASFARLVADRKR